MAWEVPTFAMSVSSWKTNITHSTTFLFVSPHISVPRISVILPSQRRQHSTCVSPSHAFKHATTNTTTQSYTLQAHTNNNKPPLISTTAKYDKFHPLKCLLLLHPPFCFYMDSMGHQVYDTRRTLHGMAHDTRHTTNYIYVSYICHKIVTRHISLSTGHIRPFTHIISGMTNTMYLNYSTHLFSHIRFNGVGLHRSISKKAFFGDFSCNFPRDQLHTAPRWLKSCPTIS